MHKKLTISFVLLFVTSLICAQPWMRKFEGQVQEPTFFEIKEAFEEYADGKEQEAKEGINPSELESEEREIPGFEMYKRWEFFNESRVDARGNFPNSMALMNAFQAQKNYQLRVRTDTANHGNWNLIGPDKLVPKGGGMGRINVVRFDPQNPKNVWVGAPAGGLWKSIDGGNSWLPTTTDKLPVIGISDIAIHPTDSKIMYIATGDAPGGGGSAGSTSSIGILKSTDAGVSWKQTGMQIPISQTNRISKILINPFQPDTLLAATTKGIFISADAGNTWIMSSGGSFKDIEYQANNPNIVFASTTNSIYKSSDGGFTFSSQNLAASFINSTNIGRIELGVTPANPKLLYALCSDAATEGFLQLYKSNDTGNTWVQKATQPNLLGWNVAGSDARGQAFYTLTLAISPTDDDNIFVGGVNIWNSTDGGNSFNISAHWYGDNGTPYIHADIHDIQFVNSSTIFVGSDGGVFNSSDLGQSWNDLSDGLQIMQLYRMSASTSSESLLIAGAQDNGTNLFSNGIVSYVHGGDGMDCTIDPNNDSRIFASLPNGSFVKSESGGINGSFSNITPNGQKGRGKWLTPMAISKSQSNIIYIGYRELYKSVDSGENWTKATTNLSNNASYKYIAIAPTDENIVYACTDNKIYKTNNGGTTWKLVMNGIPIGQQFTYIAVSEDDANEAFVVTSNYNDSTKVYKTTDGAISWKNYTLKGLPAIPINCITFQKNNHSRVYVGTDFGIYYTDTTITEWKDFNNGLPNTFVMDMDIFYPSLLLRAATYGRGIWQSKLIVDEVGGLTEQQFANSVDMFPNPALNSINVNLNFKSNQSTQFTLFSVDGKEVLQETIFPFESSKIVDVSNLQRGTYIAVINSGDKTSRKKLIILPN